MTDSKRIITIHKANLVNAFTMAGIQASVHSHSKIKSLFSIPLYTDTIYLKLTNATDSMLEFVSK